MRWVLAFCFVPLLSCSPYVHSPPGRSFPLESSKALYPRETGVQVEGGGSAGGEVGVPGFTLRVRHGIVKQLDGSAEFNFESVRPNGDLSFAGANHFLMSGRIGLKYAIIDHIAITGGCAVGGWAGGAFVSPDISLILAWENPYAIPFITGGGYTSHPFNAKTVVLHDSDPTGEDFFGLPVLTWGWTVSGGLRIPIGGYDNPHSTPPAILLGVGFRSAIFDGGYDVAGVSTTEGRRREPYLYGSVGFEYVFTPKKNEP